MMRSAMGWLLALIIAMGAAPAMAQDDDAGGCLLYTSPEPTRPY